MRDGRRGWRIRACLLAGAALALLGGHVVAGELPDRGTVAHGKVSISKPSRDRMQIRQKSDKAIVNWNGFSIGRKGRVDIAQPSAKAAILNRVTGKTRSSIRGRLTANGQVYLVNPNGIEITGSGKVRTGAFVASTLDIGDKDFRKGRRVFAAKGSPAAVSNAGVVRTSSYAALLGGKVDNAGTIVAERGSVGLGAGRKATLRLSGGFLQVALPPSNDGDAALIDSSGVIRAGDGSVEIRAATARALARQAVNLSGVVEARSVGTRGGVVVIDGGAGGGVTLSGRLDAGAGRSGEGGSVVVTGDAVRLAGARIDASGPAGGGRVRIGGGLQGKGPLPRARTTRVDAASAIAADATHDGDGGSVVVWSDDFTRFAGKIRARGGPNGGDGGFAEVSGKRLLSFSGAADLRAPAGVFGTLLLDPFDLTIDDAPTSDVIEGESGERIAAGDNSVLNVDDLTEQLALSSVVVSTVQSDGGDQDGDITVAAPVAWDGASTLTLEAAGDVVVDSPITAPAGTLEAVVSGAITTSAAIEVASLDWEASGDVEIGGAVAAQSGSVEVGGNLSIAGAGMDFGTLALEVSDGVTIDAPLTGGDLTIASGGGIAMTAAGAMTLDALTLNADGEIDALGAVAAGLFDLQSGAWTQTEDPLPSFAATDFRVSPNGEASFLRVLGGNGDTTPFLVADVFGLQGMRDFSSQNFALSGDIDASGSAGWNDDGDGALGFDPIGVSVDGDGAPVFAADFDGGGFAIDGLFIDRPGDFGGVGLFAALGVGGSVHDVRLTNADVTGGDATGALAGAIEEGATVENVAVGGAVASAGSQLGGLAGDNAGTIVNSISEASVAWSAAPGLIQVGGLVGQNSGLIAGAFAKGPVAANGGPADDGSSLRVGGLVGENGGTITQSYATGSVTATSGFDVFVGGLVGGNGGLIEETFAAGPVSGSGPGTEAVGGLVGGDFEGQTTASFWDVDASGQAESGGGVGLSSADMQDGPGFAAAAGWDFETVWAPPSVGFYPALYAVDPVVRLDPADATRLYGAANPAFAVADVFGGPGAYVFGPAGDMLDAVGTIQTDADAASVVGDYEIVASGTATSALGVAYRVTTLEPGALTVTPAPLTITAGDGSKTYGVAFDLDIVGFDATGLLNGDTVDAVTLTSDGAPATAVVDDYDILASDAVGARLGNYAIAFEPGALAVTPAPLTITAGDGSKTYGMTFDLDTVGFDATGLLNGDTVDAVTLTSDGAPATAVVGDYDILAGDAVGARLGNYAIAFEPGTLDVTPAPLTIAADDGAKPFGERLVFRGDEFDVEGLRNDDRVDLATLTSAGAPADAAVGAYDIAIGAARGVGLGNYAIEYVPGNLTVTPANVASSTNLVSLIPETGVALANPPDVIRLVLAAGGRPPEPLPGAGATADQETLAYLQSASSRLEADVEACRQTIADSGAYLACLGVALDTYAAAIEARILELPAPLRGVSATIREASRALGEARATAASRRAGASDAEAAAIDRAAMETALAAIETARREVRDAISLLRADEPQLASLGEAQGEEIAGALAFVADELIRAIDL